MWKVPERGVHAASTSQYKITLKRAEARLKPALLLRHSISRTALAACFPNSEL